MAVQRRRYATTSPVMIVKIPLPTFEEVFAQERLRESFRSLLVRRYDVVWEKTRILPGADRIQLVHFERDLDKHLRAVERKVLQGRYTFAPFLGVDIPKPGTSEKRPISIGTIRGALVQRALYDYLYPRIDPQLEDCVFGYRSGCSAHSAIKAILGHIRCGLTSVVDVDVSRFFDSVDHQILMSKIQALGVDDRATKLLYRFLRTGRVDASIVAIQRKQTSRQEKYAADLRDVGVPQGGILSGLLSNLFLAEFDSAICSRHRGYVRYADDFVICCSDQGECLAAHQLVANEVRKLRLSLNAKKTSPYVPISAGIDFLGFRLTDKLIRVRSRNIHKFKNRIRYVIETQQDRRTPSSSLQGLVRRLNFKIRGPNEQQRQRLREDAGIRHPHLRSWVGFFRIVTDIEQIRQLDRWIRSEISSFMWRKHRTRVQLSDMQTAGLCSLVGSLFRARQKDMAAQSTQGCAIGAAVFGKPTGPGGGKQPTLRMA